MKTTFVKEPFKANGVFYAFGEEVSFDEETATDFIARGLLTTDTIKVEDEETSSDEESEEDKEITEADINKMTGVQLKELVTERGLADIDVTVSVKDLKVAVIEALIPEEEESEEAEGEL